jgi:hypothetical protein
VIRQLVVISALVLCACSTVEYRPNVQEASHSGVRVLYEYPQDAKFKSLGTVEAYVYQPGWRAPTVADVLPKLKDKAAAVGGNALIVRSHQVGQFDRSINVTAEVLVVEQTPGDTP